MFEKKIFTQTGTKETDLKIPKALINRVFKMLQQAYFRDLTSGTKLKKMIWKKKIFTQTHLNKAGNGFENSKGAY